MFNALAVEKDAASGGTAASVKQPALEHLPDTEKRPLESETWAGCVEAVGGALPARGADILKGQVKGRVVVDVNA
ncbi:hypothetical protein SAMN04488105_10977 [Salipiger thiooxidans]|uniref:Uncharacterized protein n=1 Tax=Salipiger thiooxidans TaxID=282683 RepID=A0A1G7GM26_9RHOB|nr:hypothetical protein [Salipiger thiooxidans]SDE89039.1 hypothetical protein SAMN04488105_10977 [Salipiger thiooxidans]